MARFWCRWLAVAALSLSLTGAPCRNCAPVAQESPAAPAHDCCPRPQPAAPCGDEQPPECKWQPSDAAALTAEKDSQSAGAAEGALLGGDVPPCEPALAAACIATASARGVPPKPAPPPLPLRC